MSSHLCFDSLFPQLNQLETLLLQGGLGSLLQTNGSIAASPSHDIARRKQQPSKISVTDPSILPSTNSINNSNQSSNLLNQDRSWLPVVEDLVKNEWNQCPSSIPYCEQDYEASDLAYLKEVRQMKVWSVCLFIYLSIYLFVCIIFFVFVFVFVFVFFFLFLFFYFV